MPQSTLKLKSSVTKRNPTTVNPDLKARLADLPQQEKPAPKPSKDQDAAKRNPHALQTWFIVSAIKEAVPVRIKLTNGEWLAPCLIKQTDTYTLLTDDGELLFKHAIASIKHERQ